MHVPCQMPPSLQNKQLKKAAYYLTGDLPPLNAFLSKMRHERPRYEALKRPSQLFAACLVIDELSLDNASCVTKAMAATAFFIQDMDDRYAFRR
jgi:hypothetical protein